MRESSAESGFGDFGTKIDLHRITSGLNPEQEQAVTADPGNLLVVAGAGSGKTRVLVHRIAWLTATEEASPEEILSVTFTNKAAGEMKSRIASLIGPAKQEMMVGTFHSLCHRLLRIHAEDVGLGANFEIMDSPDQLRLVKRVIRDMGLKDKEWTPREGASYINLKKEEGQRAGAIEPPAEHKESGWLRVYREYEEQCNRLGLVDFAELLLRCQELWLNNDRVLARYKRRFRHILVDELQDTNIIQYSWLRLLSVERSLELGVPPAHVFAVGDDDQSIYGWRGAKISNFLNFSDHFPGTKVIRLERNYRSTGNILRAANALIARNRGRMGKNLHTRKPAGDPIRVFQASDEAEEADFVGARVDDWIRDHGLDSLNGAAVLYRTNAQSRMLEQAFRTRSIPYRIYAGQRFFDRTEVRNALGYLRLMVDPASDLAFERVVNTPARGIGDRTLEEIRSVAASTNSSLWSAAVECVNSEHVGGRARTAVKDFLILVRDLRRRAKTMSVTDIASMCVHDTGLLDWHTREGGETAQVKKENLEEFLVAVQQFARSRTTALPTPNEKDGHGIEESGRFLNEVALQSSAPETNKGPRASLMTLHSSKGLEFPLVFIVGLERGLMPMGGSAADDPEEERRLMYVGITRCMQTLYLTHATSRMKFGASARRQAPSEFFRELPQELLLNMRPAYGAASTFPRFGKSRVPQKAQIARLAGTADSRPQATVRGRGGSRESNAAGWVGQSVYHSTYGQGIIVREQSEGSRRRLEINFSNSGRKWLMASNAHLKFLEPR